MIINNKLNIQFNRENIEKDFDIYMVSKDGKGDFFKTNILDIPTIQFKAKSVVYTYGNNWFVMFDKDSLDKRKFKETIIAECPDVIINKVDLMDKKTIYPNVLAQLLFNSLHSPERKRLQYNNLSGKLYYVYNEWMHFNKKKELVGTFYLLRFKLSKDFYMTMTVETYSNASLITGQLSKSQFVFDKESGIFRKKLKNDKYDLKDCYIFKNIHPSSHNTIDFLDFSSYEKFSKSKVGIYGKFICDIKEYLSCYLTVENGGYEDYESFEPIDANFENKEYKDLIKTRPTIVVDAVGNKDSLEFCNKVVDNLKKYYGLNVAIGEPKQEACNIRVIRNKDYYVNKNTCDPYNMISSNMIIQHITMDDFKFSDEKESPAFKKIIQELIIKSDIKDGKFSIVDWEKGNYKGSWTFVRGKSYWAKDSKDNNIKCYKFYRMVILNDGNFNVEMYNNNKFILDEEWNAIEDVYMEFDKSGKEREVEGLVYRNIKNINVIMKTEQTTMPNFERLEEVLSLTDKRNKVPVKVIIDCCYEFKNDSKEFVGETSSFIESLNELPEHETLGNINKILDMRKRKKFGTTINRFIYQNTGVLINPELKRKENREIYFDALLDIKYFYDKGKLYYFVGTTAKNLQGSLHNACLIREVVTTGDKIEFNELMRLMAVEFVRNGQYTVLPFPFKYLNEIISKDSKFQLL